ncbi:hypothetical protein [Humibacter sp.]|uniref:hypothetical protein n=1 Tax=Humibacter sp. TaxID=1940291 RepID=UPI003F817B1E
MHQTDLAAYVKSHPSSTIAGLVNHGLEYTAAKTTLPSDSFPGMVAQFTGAVRASAVSTTTTRTTTRCSPPAQRIARRRPLAPRCRGPRRSTDRKRPSPWMPARA